MPLHLVVLLLLLSPPSAMSLSPVIHDAHDASIMSSAEASTPLQLLNHIMVTAAIDSPSCAPPQVLSRCITLALRLHSAAPSPASVYSDRIHNAIVRRLSALVSSSTLAAAVHVPPSNAASYTSCLTLASSFLSLRLLPLSVKLARVCAIIWPRTPPPPRGSSTNVKECLSSLQQCVADAVSCDASSATQAQYSAHGIITHKLQQPLCALPAVLAYVSIFSRSPTPPLPLIMHGARACVSASLFHCAFLLLSHFPSSSLATSPSTCLVTWTAIMSLHLPPPPFPPHMFTPNCIPLLLLLAQGSHGVGAASFSTLAELWPRALPQTQFRLNVWGQDTKARELIIMQVPVFLILLALLNIYFCHNASSTIESSRNCRYAGEFSSSSSVGREVRSLSHRSSS
jgi:hypothetical protein